MRNLNLGEFFAPPRGVQSIGKRAPEGRATVTDPTAWEALQARETSWPNT
jgi:hypothetical protein